MEEQFVRFERIGDVMALYGRDIVLALVILVVGIIAAKLLVNLFKRIASKFTSKETLVALLSNIFYVLVLVFVIAATLHQAGVETIIIRRTLAAISLAAIGLIMVFRPLIPSLPFKVGNTVKAGGILGKVEATTILNTRLRTFDGKTVFVPNSKILNDNVINYHFIPERQIRLVFGISYHADLLKAKKILAEVLFEDPRVLEKPAARVFVVNLGENAVELAARPWVKNLDYWRTRCDLIEKVKLHFDQEGITIAFPQRDIHIYQETVDAEGPEL